MLRKILDTLYRLSDWLGALAVFTIFALLLAQVLFGLFNRATLAIAGFAPGIAVPSYAELSSYLLVSAVFFATAGALRHGAHVRVNLLLGALPAGAVVGMEFLSGLIGVLVSVFFAWRAFVMAYQSWSFGDLSYGELVIPMWLPQLPMGLGLTMLAIAFADYCVSAISGGWPMEGQSQMPGAEGAVGGE